MLKNKDLPFFRTLKCLIYPANKCLNVNNGWHFNIYEQDKFHVQFSLLCKKFYNLKARLMGRLNLY